MEQKCKCGNPGPLLDPFADVVASHDRSKFTVTIESGEYGDSMYIPRQVCEECADRIRTIQPERKWKAGTERTPTTKFFTDEQRQMAHSVMGESDLELMKVFLRLNRDLSEVDYFEEWKKGKR